MKILKPREEVIYGSSAIPPSEYIPNQTEKLRTINGESAYYTFLGWKDDYSSIIEDTLIDSLWVKSPILKIYDCSGEEIFNNHVPYGSNFELPIIEENFNFKFLNWDNNIYINNNILYNIVLDITLTAECLEKHQITIFNCNGEVESQLFDIYADPDYLATLQKLSDYEYLIICPPKKVIVTYITDLGDIYAREELDAGEIAPSLTPSITYSCLAYDHLDGYDFSPLTEDITITAVYIPTKYNLTILYLDTNHEEIRSSETITDLCLGTSYTTTAPDIPNYEFVAWNDGFPYKENEINILGETSVIATFKKCEYNLTFVNTDGTIRERQVVAYGTIPTFPELNPDSCETNLSWQENGKDAVPAEVTEDHIYKAVASKKTVTITKNLCGGNTSTETITCGTRYNPAGSWILNGDPYTVQELTLDTILTQADCSITIKFDDGGNIQSFDIPRNSKLNTTPTTSRPNKTFLGWFRGDELFSILTIFTTNTTFYARYESLTCNVTYKINNEEVRKLTVEANALFKLYYPEDQVITWHTDSSLHNPITGDYYSTPTDLILYGKIILTPYTLTINQCNGDTLVRHLAGGTVLTGTESYFQLNTLTATYSYNIRFPYTIKSDVTINETCKTLNCSYVVNYLDTQGNTIGYSQTGIAAYGSSKTFTALDIEGYESPSLTELTVLFVPDSAYYVGGKFVINFVYTRNCIVTLATQCSDVTLNKNKISVKAGSQIKNSNLKTTYGVLATIKSYSCVTGISIPTTTITEDATINVTCVEKSTVTITFSAMNPTGIRDYDERKVLQSFTIPCGSSLAQEGIEYSEYPKFPGYTTTGWYCSDIREDDNSGVPIGIDFYNYIFKDNALIECTYTPKLVEPDPVYYNITFLHEHTNGDIDSKDHLTVLEGSTITFDTFDPGECEQSPQYWTYNGVNQTSPPTATSNMTFVATYTKKRLAILYKTQFDGDATTQLTYYNSAGGSPNKEIDCGASFTPPQIKSEDHYTTPTVWTVGNKSYTPGNSYSTNEPLVLIANYVSKIYTVKYKYRLGSSGSYTYAPSLQQTGKYLTLIKVQAFPSVSGYLAPLSWSLDDFTTYEPGLSYIIEGDSELYATYNEIPSEKITVIPYSSDTVSPDEPNLTNNNLQHNYYPIGNSYLINKPSNNRVPISTLQSPVSADIKILKPTLTAIQPENYTEPNCTIYSASGSDIILQNNLTLLPIFYREPYTRFVHAYELSTNSSKKIYCTWFTYDLNNQAYFGVSVGYEIIRRLYDKYSTRSAGYGGLSTVMYVANTALENQTLEFEEPITFRTVVNSCYLGVDTYTKVFDASDYSSLIKRWRLESTSSNSGYYLYNSVPDKDGLLLAADIDLGLIYYRNYVSAENKLKLWKAFINEVCTTYNIPYVRAGELDIQKFVNCINS